MPGTSRARMPVLHLVGPRAGLAEHHVPPHHGGLLPGAGNTSVFHALNHGSRRVLRDTPRQATRLDGIEIHGERGVTLEVALESASNGGVSYGVEIMRHDPILDCQLAMQQQLTVHRADCADLNAGHQQGVSSYLLGCVSASKPELRLGAGAAIELLG